MPDDNDWSEPIAADQVQRAEILGLAIAPEQRRAIEARVEAEIQNYLKGPPRLQ